MYKLLLVDDESIVREKISEIIDWEHYNISLIGSCANAIEATEVILEHKPDIVITDIKMPVMNGIELIKKVKSLGIKCEFIILSGYDEFDFAKKAMEENIKHYLLKPCSEKEIGEVLLKVIADIKERKSIEKRIEAQDIIKHILLQQYIDLALKNRQPDSNMQQLLDTMFVEPEQIYFISFNYDFAISDYESVYECFSELAKLTLSKIISPLLKIGNTIGCFYFLSEEYSNSKIVALFVNKLSEKLTEAFIINDIKNFKPSELFSCFADFIKDYSEIEVLSNSGLQGYDNQIFYTDVDVSVIQDKLSKSIEKTDIDSIKNGVRTMFLKYERNFTVMLFTKLFISYSYSGVIQTSSLSSILNKMYATKDLESLIDSISKVVFDVMNADSKNNNFVDKIIKYIDEHLDDSNLNLKWCAKELVYMNEDYVSRAFTKQTGENFSTYLNNKRIERAKLLLSIMGEEGRTYKVAEQVGFGHNPQYFSKLFKKITGYTPKEYREKCN